MLVFSVGRENLGVSIFFTGGESGRRVNLVSRRRLISSFNYIASYTGPLLFLFEWTHNYSVDKQGIVPWWFRRVGRSKVRSVSLVRVPGYMPWWFRRVGRSKVRSVSLVRVPGYILRFHRGPKVCEILVTAHSHFF